ncbi:hypothetical protein BMS3Bbin04_01944 [bacterium BMS3Bbin04]|nr:hypothetical protein BMS3Bbin04_01944 [bacterium BMS3Bbin04]
MTGCDSYSMQTTVGETLIQLLQHFRADPGPRNVTHQNLVSRAEFLFFHLRWTGWNLLDFTMFVQALKTRITTVHIQLREQSVDLFNITLAHIVRCDGNKVLAH